MSFISRAADVDLTLYEFTERDVYFFTRWRSDGNQVYFVALHNLILLRKYFYCSRCKVEGEEETQVERSVVFCFFFLLVTL